MDVEGKIGVKKWQRLPKKIVVSRRIPIFNEDNEKYEKYEMVVSMWVMDVPYSVQKPKISLTLTHGKGLKRQYFRLVFPNWEALYQWFVDMSLFLIEKSEEVTRALEEAIKEWKATWEKVMEVRKGKTIDQEKIASYNANNSEIKANKSEVQDGQDSSSGK